MFDIFWKPADYEEQNKKANGHFGGYHYYSVSTHEDAEGFCEWLRYKKCTDIKIKKCIPYNYITVSEDRAKRGYDTTETEKTNIDFVANNFDAECEPGNIPYTFRDIYNMVEHYKLDWDKPIIIDINGIYPLEHIYFIGEDETDNNELIGLIVLDVNK